MINGLRDTKQGLLVSHDEKTLTFTLKSLGLLRVQKSEAFIV